MEKLGLYLHIPFCLGKCGYCDFYSGAFSPEERKAYVAALCRHLEAEGERAVSYTVDTVYLGGGTPTLLEEAELARILHTVCRCYRLEPDAEVTVECNPATLSGHKAEVLRAAGVNRVSVGAQSMCEKELQALGRRHTVTDFLHTVEGLKAAGFQNISADLMFGIPHQTPESFAKTLDSVLELDLQHISAYGLQIEEGTPFYAERDTLALPSEDSEAEMQVIAVEKLTAAGFCHYEISNFARPGYESRHNLRYWLGAPYLGFGPGAHSFFENKRYFCEADLKKYLYVVQNGRFPELVAGLQTVTEQDALNEYIMLRMRLATGMDEAELQARFGVSLREVCKDVTPLLEGGLLKRTATGIAFTERGWTVSNSILADWCRF